MDSLEVIRCSKPPNCSRMSCRIGSSASKRLPDLEVWTPMHSAVQNDVGEGDIPGFRLRVTPSYDLPECL
jgi:hypothetical protein